MHRIDSPNSVAVLPTLAPPGAGGFFSPGRRPSILATVVDEDWLNAVQEEISHVIEGAGVVLDKRRLDQLLLAINILIQRNTPIIPPAPDMPFLPLVGGRMQGAILQARAPATHEELTHRAYVDAKDQEIWTRLNWVDQTQGGLTAISANGTFTVGAAARVLEVWATGAGGGGGGAHAMDVAAGGGGAGGTAFAKFAVAPGQQFWCQIGAGGAGGGFTGSNGLQGTSSQFGEVLGASGGLGGEGSQAQRSGGSGGMGYGGAFFVSGGLGGDGRSGSLTNRGGDGGSSFWGGGGRAGMAAGGGGRPGGSAWGSGGGGGYEGSTGGGTGANGIILVSWSR